MWRSVEDTGTSTTISIKAEPDFCGFDVEKRVNTQFWQQRNYGKANMGSFLAGVLGFCEL